MRVLVIGASGLVGSHVLDAMKQAGHEVKGTYKACQVEGLVELDLADEKRTRSLIAEFRPEWLVHAAGWTWVDGCERDPDRAYRENAEQVSALAEICRAEGTKLAYFSTSYVFDGTAGPYDERAVPGPINVYGWSKLRAEESIMAILPEQSLILRTICVWGAERRRKNFVYQVLAAVSEGREMLVPGDQRGNPTWAGDIAGWTLELIGRGQSGIWNLAGDNPDTTRGEWTGQIVDGFVKQTHGTRPSSICREVATSELAQPARRPLAGGLITQRIRTFSSRRPRPANDIRDVLDSLQEKVS